MWPCCDFTSSDDDEHNTDNKFLLLFADVAITPTLLEGLTVVDVLHVALVADSPWIFSRFRSNIPLHLISSHFLTILSTPHLEHVCYTRLMTFTTASLLGPRSWKGTHILSITLYGRNSWFTVSTQDALISTSPVLPTLSDYSLRPRHTQPPGPNAQCPITQPWFAFRTAVSLHVPSHRGSSRSVYTLSLRDAGTGATFLNFVTTTLLHHAWLRTLEHRSVNSLVLPDPWLKQGGLVTFPACALHQLFVR